MHSVSDEGRPFTGIGAWLQSLVDDGHTIEVDDRRMYANFGDLRFDAAGCVVT